ncbi:hypothetical protein HN451_08495, partial [archaeon]|nr:hypothetical protein [archaeon]
MTLELPEDMDELVYWTARKIEDGNVKAWTYRGDCPECGKAETGAGEISQNDLEKAYCDAQVLENGRNKATIRPSVRREVMNRDNHTCQGQGCVSK